MEFFKQFDEEQKELEAQSVKQAEEVHKYIQESVNVQNEPVFPWAPTTRIQGSGGSMVNGIEAIDVDSELMNITRKLSNEPKEQYIPDGKKVTSYSNLKDGFFHEESTRLTNPAFELRGQVKNRWFSPYLHPQAHVIEPFERNGDDTYLALIDNHKACKA